MPHDDTARDDLLRNAKLFCNAFYEATAKPLVSEVTAYGLTDVQYACMRYIKSHGSPTVGDIASGLRISSAAATRLIDRLEKKGLATREGHLGDRRSIRVALTPNSAEIVERLVSLEKSLFESITARISPGDLEALARGLEGFLAAALTSPDIIEAVCLRCGDEHVARCLGNLAHRRMTGRDIEKP